MKPLITVADGRQLLNILDHNLLSSEEASRENRARFRKLCRSIAILGFLISSSALAQPGFFEAEPNDTPADANPIAGAVTVFGAMPAGDQDGFLWTVSDNDARKRWSFELHGIPGALTIADLLRVEYAENGRDIAAAELLMKMGTRDGVTPSIHQGQLFEPGEYMIGIATTGGPDVADDGPYRPPLASLSFGEEDPPDAVGEAGVLPTPSTSEPADPRAWRLIITEEDSLSVTSNPEPRETRDQARAIRPGETFATFDTSETAWYSLSFDERTAAQRWDFDVRAPIGRDLRVRLLDVDGAELSQGNADEHGLIRFSDLAPEADTTWYFELTTPEPGFIHAVSSVAAGVRVAGDEAEPNDTRELANRADFSQPLTGQIGPDDSYDYFRFTVDEVMADQLSKLQIVSEPPVNLSFCLATADGVDVQCRDGTTPIDLPDLLLSAGEWRLGVTRASMATEYAVMLEAQGPVAAGIEMEPNDLLAYASGVPSNMRVRGRFTGGDTDFYRIVVSGEAELWRFQVIGDEIFEVGYYTGAGEQKAIIRAQPGQRRVRLDDVYLLPGEHFVRVQGHDGGKYTLLARAIGPPNPDGELEPNDASNRQRLAMGQTRVGLLAEPNDEDYYRFFLANWDHIRLTVKPPAEGIIDADISWYGELLGDGQPAGAGEAITLEGLFPPGDYQITLRPRQVSDGEYTLSLERRPRFSCATDCEPNGMGQIFAAAPLPPDLVLAGIVGDWRDRDDYQLPAFSTPTEILLRSDAAVGELSLGRSHVARERLQYDAALGAYRVTVPAGEAHRLMLDTYGAPTPYRLQLEFPNGPIRPVAEPLAVDLSMSFDHRTVAAFLTNGQRLTGELVIVNNADEALTTILEAATSDYRWSVKLDQKELTVPIGGRGKVGVQLDVPADAWADRSVRASVRVLDTLGRQAETWQDIAVDGNAAEVDAVLHWPIAPALLGGFNAAWMPFGGELTVDLSESPSTDALQDGLVFPGVAFFCCTDADGWSEDEIPHWTLDLPGDEPRPVAGVAINHFGWEGAYRNIRKATLQLSQDGVTFEDALSFETLPVKTEQHFALPQAIAARFARLRIESTFQESSNQRVFAAEWKVILDPGNDLSDGAGFNIADPELGGHLVWDGPPEAVKPVGILTNEAQAGSSSAAWRSVTKDYVIGFQQNRAAQITRVEWLYPPDLAERNKSYDRVSVSAALESPVGPWQSLGDMDLSDAKTAAALELDQPAWARFVRLTAHKRSGATDPFEPGLVRIQERPTGPDYRSVLTEWGDIGPRAYYELQAGLPPAAELTAAGNVSRATAAALDTGARARGEVSLSPSLEHWYRVKIPATDNTLAIEVTGDPTVRTIVAMENVNGEAIAMRRIDSERLPGRHLFEAIVEPGSEVWIRVFEPPRNVMFSWDTSASVAPYIPMINSSLIAFSSQVVRGREAVNLMPFAMRPLLRDWYGEPYALQTMLNDYRAGLGSSSAEWTLKNAALELAQLPGTKAIVVMTDAETPHDGELWQAMQDVQPRIFSIGVAGSRREEQHLLRDWASVNGGHFTQLIYEGETEVAFNRATTLMRRPADYTLEVNSEFRELPGPGRLLVMAGADTAGGAGAAVELILDASGSMLQRIDGRRRIAVAKEVLTEAVREHIPPGTAVALRVFGHREPDACRTDLEIPLGPLNPDTAAASIEGIQAMNLARTPIAESLAAVESDLAGTSGGAVVVLVTDGEETCDGNPEAVITALGDRGVGVSLNIVGFAIDDAELEAQFEAWAKLGGGRYFAASDSGDLSESLEVALRVSFTVYDQGGNEVAVGQVGGKGVELEQGVYRVVVSGAEPRTFDAVEVQGESEVLLEL